MNYPATVGQPNGEEWRLSRVTVRPDTCCAVTMVTTEGATRTYLFDKVGSPPFLRDAGDDASRVLNVVDAIRRAEVVAGGLSAGWMLRDVEVLAGDRFRLTVVDPGGGTRGYAVTAEVADVKGVPLLAIGGPSQLEASGREISPGRDGSLDRELTRACLDLISVIHAAWHRPIRLALSG